MKKYNKPTMEIIALQSKENMAAVSPLDAATTYTAGGVATTVYNLALLDVASVGAK